MKLLIIFGLLAVTLAHPLNHLEEWEVFKVKHGKNYATLSEEEKRKSVFLDNLNFIQEHNAKYDNGEVTFQVGVNQFADLTVGEFSAMMNGYRQMLNVTGSKAKFPSLEDGEVDLPKTVDWRNKGAVTPVKDQGSCGSCWAFSATGSLEGQNFLKNNELVSLSEQNLVDCSGAEGNEGCGGGWMDQAFEYVIKNNGIDTEKSYPYKGVDGKCHYKASNKGAGCTGYIDIPTGNEKSLQVVAAKIGPVSVAIDASHSSFQLYAKGVYNEPNCKKDKNDLDHGVLVVGYGKLKKGGAYWLVKNSWGTDWGLDGYIMMSRNKDNQCGIATQASYPDM